MFDFDFPSKASLFRQEEKQKRRARHSRRRERRRCLVARDLRRRRRRTSGPQDQARVRGNAGTSGNIKINEPFDRSQPPVNSLGRSRRLHKWLVHQLPRCPPLSTSRYPYSRWLQTLSASSKVVMLSVDCGLVSRPYVSSRNDPEHATQCSPNARRRSRMVIVSRTSRGDCGIASWPWPHLKEDRKRCGV